MEVFTQINISPSGADHSEHHRPINNNNSRLNISQLKFLVSKSLENCARRTQTRVEPGKAPGFVHRTDSYQLSDLEQSRDGPGVAQVQAALPGCPGRCCRGDDGVRHDAGKQHGKQNV